MEKNKKEPVIVLHTVQYVLQNSSFFLPRLDGPSLATIAGPTLPHRSDRRRRRMKKSLERLVALSFISFERVFYLAFVYLQDLCSIFFLSIVVYYFKLIIMLFTTMQQMEVDIRLLVSNYRARIKPMRRCTCDECFVRMVFQCILVIKKWIYLTSFFFCCCLF